jgi:hypothetical protein
MGFFFLEITVDFDLTSDFIRELVFTPLFAKGSTGKTFAAKLLQTLISVLLSTLLLLVLLGVNGSIAKGLM